MILALLMMSWWSDYFSYEDNDDHWFINFAYKAQLPQRSLWGSHSSLILPYINTYKVCSISRATLSWLILTLIYTYFINFKLNIKHHSSIIYVIDLIVIDLSCYEACYIHKAQATSSTYAPQSYVKLLKIMYACKYI